MAWIQSPLSAVARKGIEGVLQNKFFNSIAVTTSGTLVGQFIVVLSSPVLARIYSPEDIGQFSAFFALSAILLPLASLRYELAIPLPQKERHARALVYLNLCLLPATSIAVGTAVWRFREIIADWMQCPMIISHGWILPLVLLTTAGFQVMNYWGIRRKEFKVLAQTKVLRACTMVISQVLLSSLGALGLLIGQCLSGFAAFGYLIVKLFSADQFDGRGWKLINKVARRYRNFPIYSAVGGLVNSAGLSLPIILVSSDYGVFAAGQLGILHRVLSLPVTLLGASVADVYLAEASKAKHAGQLFRLFLLTSGGLAVLAVLFAGAIVCCGPLVISMLLGDQWSVASEWSKTIGIMVAFQLVATPVSQSLNILDKQRIQLSWDVLRLIVVVAVFEISSWLEVGVGNAITAYALAMITTYSMLWVLQFVVVRRLQTTDR